MNTEKLESTIKDLRVAVISLGICCYSEDKHAQETVLKIGEIINNAIDFLTELKEG